jgi:hypothetical protein
MKDTLPVGATLEAPSKRTGESVVNVNVKYARARRGEGKEKSDLLTKILVDAVATDTMDELIERKTGQESKTRRKGKSRLYKIENKA